MVKVSGPLLSSSALSLAWGPLLTVMRGAVHRFDGAEVGVAEGAVLLLRGGGEGGGGATAGDGAADGHPVADDSVRGGGDAGCGDLGGVAVARGCVGGDELVVAQSFADEVDADLRIGLDVKKPLRAGAEARDYDVAGGCLMVHHFQHDEAPLPGVASQVFEHQ